MICNTCHIPMHQAVIPEGKGLPPLEVGGGEANDEQYTTWELKECHVCHRRVMEHYTAVVIGDEEPKKIWRECERIANGFQCLITR